MCAATLVFVACNNNKTNPDDKNDPDEPTQESVLVLDKTSITLEVDATETINANVESEWTSSDAEVASVAGNGKEAVVTAKKEGNTVITAKTKGGQVKTCVVLVKNAGGQQGGETVELKGKHVWPIALDGTTADAQVNKSKIVADFRPNDVDQFLYVWENGSVYEAGEGKRGRAAGVGVVLDVGRVFAVLTQLETVGLRGGEARNGAVQDGCWCVGGAQLVGRAVILAGDDERRGHQRHHVVGGHPPHV